MCITVLMFVLVFVALWLANSIWEIHQNLSVRNCGVETTWCFLAQLGNIVVLNECLQGMGCVCDCVFPACLRYVLLGRWLGHLFVSVDGIGMFHN